MVKKERIYRFKKNTPPAGKIIYWMSRDQRSLDNWGLLYAQELAKQFQSEMAVVFTLSESFLGATERQFDFMIQGLKEIEQNLRNKNIPLYLLRGNPSESLIRFAKSHSVQHIVCDFDPLRIKQKWQNEVNCYEGICLYEVDSHNIIPARFVSNKREFGAYTLRPKINRNLENFLEAFPHVERQDKLADFSLQKNDWQSALEGLTVDRSVKPVNWIKPGPKAAHIELENFISGKLSNYNELRNDPNRDILSNLSPWLHFGNISSQRIALTLIQKNPHDENSKSFLEEIIVRKELSDNYCLHNSSYDSLDHIPEWAKSSLDKHRYDKRDYVYSLEEFEKASTHEELWNAAQNQMVRSGKMHGYMRMYWAKKILEWSNSPEEAMRIAIELNDKYELDGRDPNGYTGVAWAIGGVHDRAWKERDIFGKIRYMNLNGAKRKFDVNSYITKWNSATLF